MSIFLGMDTAQVRSHAERLRTASGDVQVLRERLATTVGATTWQGADAETFRGRWEEGAGCRLAHLSGELTAVSDRADAEADAQEVASHGAGGPGGEGRSGEGWSGEGRSPSPASGGTGGRDGTGYLDRDRPWIPDWLEDPAEGVVADLAGAVADGIGRGVDAGLDAVAGAAGRLGLETDGIDRVRGDAGHVGDLLEDWATGARVPTIAELGASTLLAAGSAAIAPIELFTDTGFLDPRTDVTVTDVTEVQDPSTPQDLADLIRANDEAREEMFGRSGAEEFTGLDSGQIRIQTVQADTGETAYIVHAPPTGGARIHDPDAWGAQGNSAAWDSNLRSMAGQESAAMADVVAAMSTAGPDGRPLVPPGSDVMFVGHSQGGLTASQLAADPSFNNSSGDPGSYNVTHSFSIGSPVGTVVPAQRSTQVVNVAHDSVWGPTSQVPGLPSPGRQPLHIADPVPRLDLDGHRMDGTQVSAPHVQEVRLESPQQTFDEHSQLENAHDSVLENEHGTADPTGGYHGSVRRHTDSDPVLAGLQQDIEGTYVGDGAVVVTDRVVEVGRGGIR